MIRDEIVLDAIDTLCDGIGRLNVVLDGIIDNVPMTDEEREQLRQISNDFRLAFAALQRESKPQGKLS